MPPLDYYYDLIGRAKTQLEALDAEDPSRLALVKCHNYVVDLDALVASLGTRPETELLQNAAREYKFALFAVSIGSYRHAFGSLRLFLEMALATVHFSAFEIKLRKWMASSADIVWSALVDPENGVFCKPFIRAFNPPFEEFGPQYGAIAQTVYRECSEYVHGNYHTTTSTELPLTYDSEVFMAWAQRAEVARLVVVFAFAARYLALFTKEEKELVEATMTDVLAQLAPVQAAYAAE